jgi:chitinase
VGGREFRYNIKMFRLFVLIVLIVAISAGFCPSDDRKVIYLSYADIDWNNYANTVHAAVDSGYNVLILAFYIMQSHNPYDSAQSWSAMNDTARAKTMDYVHSKGACMLISVGGATDSPYNQDPWNVGSEAAQWAIKYQLDGVDFDLENIDVGFKYRSEDMAGWITNATLSARKVLGDSRTITHAPQAPYFGTIGGNDWTGLSGGYSFVEKHSQVDWYNIQFYNQGVQCYADYNGTFVQSCSTFPHTSVGEIISNGVVANKIVIGKPVTTGDANNGYLEASAFGNLLRSAIQNGFKIGGYMGWKWEPAAQTWPSSIGSLSSESII